MAKNEQTIVVKKVIAGGHGHHGGAWKVAYADFVTAMMCFFLVMWLMGADEETKAEISHYFNHPTTPWKAGRDPASNVTRPMGERSGAGDSILTGADGDVPDALVQDPVRPINEAMLIFADLQSQVQSELDVVAYGLDVSLTSMRFSVAEDELFEQGHAALSENGLKVVAKLGKVLKKYPGYLSIEAHVNEGRAVPSGLSPYEFTMGRAVAVMHEIVGRQYMAEDHVSPVGVGNRKPFTSSAEPEATKLNNRIEFVLRSTREL